MRLARALEALQWRVWWDPDISAGQTFDVTIADALRAAGAVVVLWSHHSIVSEWVREEASEGKRRNVLIPVLVEAVELPLGFTLRQAIDLTTWDGSSGASAFIKLVAAITELNRGATGATTPPSVRPLDPALKERWREPSSRRSMTAILSLLAVLMVAMGSGAWYWDAYYRGQVEHFANVTRRWGLPQGVGRLSRAQVARRNVSIALIRHGRRNPVDELRLVTSNGNTPPTASYVPPSSFSMLNPLPATGAAASAPLTNDLLTTVRITFARDANGHILEERAFARGGRPIYTLHFASPELGEYKRNGFTSLVRESGIGYLRFSRVQAGPNAGLDERVTYFDAQQRPQPDERGSYGFRLILDTRGLVTAVINLGADGSDRANHDGVLKEVRTHDALGNIVEAATRDQNGSLRGRLGAARVSEQYDDVGNLTSVCVYDTDNELVSAPTMGAAGRTIAYDARGRVTSAGFFGPDHQPVTGLSGFARQTITWLTSNRALSRFYDPGGRPTPVLGGAFEVIETFEVSGLSIETAYRDAKGVPTRVDNGCSTQRLAYDDVGNVRELQCLNEGNAATLSTDGFSTVRVVYDELGHPLTRDFFDHQGRPGLLRQPYATIRDEYNQFGKLAKSTYVNVRGQPTRSREGFATIVYTYDSQGNRVRQAYLDEGGRPTIVVGGYATIRSEFDERGLEATTTYLDERGVPTRSDEGYAVARCDHDDRGLMARCLLLDERLKPVMSADGFASYTVKRNAAGQRLQLSYFDERGRATFTRKPGSSIRRWTYNSDGRVVERADYDTNGRPMVNAFGYAIVAYKYDEYGRETGRTLFNLVRQPLALKVVVNKVRTGSTADEAGLRPGDVLLAVGGEAVETSYQFVSRLELFRGDRARELRLIRDERIISLDLPPGRLDGLELEETAR
jgi:YD repeat-containing protein